MTIGEKIRVTRKEKGITQKELGALCGTHGEMISQYEKGMRKPKIATLKRIALALDVKLSHFVDVEDDENSLLHKVIGANSKQIKEYAELLGMSIPEFLGYLAIQGLEVARAKIINKEPVILDKELAELKHLAAKDNEKKAD